MKLSKSQIKINLKKLNNENIYNSIRALVKQLSTIREKYKVDPDAIQTLMAEIVEKFEKVLEREEELAKNSSDLDDFEEQVSLPCKICTKDHLTGDGGRCKICKLKSGVWAGLNSPK